MRVRPVGRERDANDRKPEVAILGHAGSAPSHRLMALDWCPDRTNRRGRAVAAIPRSATAPHFRFLSQVRQTSSGGLRGRR